MHAGVLGPIVAGRRRARLLRLVRGQAAPPVAGRPAVPQPPPVVRGRRAVPGVLRHDGGAVLPQLLPAERARLQRRCRPGCSPPVRGRRRCCWRRAAPTSCGGSAPRRSSRPACWWSRRRSPVTRCSASPPRSGCSRPCSSSRGAGDGQRACHLATEAVDVGGAQGAGGRSLGAHQRRRGRCRGRSVSPSSARSSPRPTGASSARTWARCAAAGGAATGSIEANQAVAAKLGSGSTAGRDLAVFADSAVRARHAHHHPHLGGDHLARRAGRGDLDARARRCPARRRGPRPKPRHGGGRATASWSRGGAGYRRLPWKLTPRRRSAPRWRTVATGATAASASRRRSRRTRGQRTRATPRQAEGQAQ